MSHYRQAAAEILAYTRAIDACVDAGGVAEIRGTFARYDANTWRKFKLAELDRRINEKGNLERGLPRAGRSWRKLDEDWQTNAKRDAWSLRDHAERRIRLPRRFNTPEVQKRLGHLLADRED